MSCNCGGNKNRRRIYPIPAKKNNEKTTEEEKKNG